MAASTSSNRRVTIILVVGGVFIALLAAYNLMGGGGGSEDSTPSIPPPVTTPDGLSSAQTPSTTAPAAPTLPNGEFDVFVTRNPFEPAIQVVSDSGSDSGGTDTGGTDTGGTDTGTTTPTTAPASPDPSAGTTVAVIDVFDQAGVLMARVQVGSTVYTVAAGQTFATSYKVVSVSGDCGQFLSLGRMLDRRWAGGRGRFPPQVAPGNHACPVA